MNDRGRGKLRGSALFMAVTIVLLVGMVTASLVLDVHLATIRSARFLDQARVQDNARSAAYLSLTDLPMEGGARMVGLFGDANDSVQMVRSPYGLLDLVQVVARSRGQEASLTAYGAGTIDPGIILHLGRTNNGLRLCGDARLKGTISVPGAEVAQGWVEGRPFTGDRMVQGDILPAGREIPPLAPGIEGRMEQLCAGTPSMVPMLRSQGHDEFVPVLELPANTRLSDRSLRGPLIIRSDDTLIVAADCVLDMVLLQAAFIVIEPGFRGRIQCFARRGMDIGPGCRLQYPSALAIVRDAHFAQGPQLNIGEGTWLQGGVVLIDRHVRGRSSGGVFIAPGALVDGELHVQGALELRGEVRGVVRTQRFVLRTSSAVHDDHLLDGLITSYPHPFPWCIGLTAPSTERTIVAWETSTSS